MSPRFLDGSIALLVGLCALMIARSTIKIAKEYERGVVFRLGRLMALRGPGLFFIFPFGIDHVRKVDLRVITLEVPQQEVITSDNVTVKVNAVIFFQVMDAQAAIVRVFNFMEATSQIAQTTLRAVLGQSSLDELLGSRDKINGKLQAIIDRQTEPWGVKVGTVELARSERRSSPPRESSRRPRSSPTPPRSSRLSPRPSPCATCRRCSTWARTRTRPSYFPFPSS